MLDPDKHHLEFKMYFWKERLKNLQIGCWKERLITQNILECHEKISYSNFLLNIMPLLSRFNLLNSKL